MGFTVVPKFLLRTHAQGQIQVAEAKSKSFHWQLALYSAFPHARRKEGNIHLFPYLWPNHLHVFPSFKPGELWSLTSSGAGS